MTNNNELEKAMLINLMNYGRAIMDSAAYQLKEGWYNEDTFRGWIMDIESTLDLPFEKELEEAAFEDEDSYIATEEEIKEAFKNDLN